MRLGADRYPRGRPGEVADVNTRVWNEGLDRGYFERGVTHCDLCVGENFHLCCRKHCSPRDIKVVEGQHHRLGPLVYTH